MVRSNQMNSCSSSALGDENEVATKSARVGAISDDTWRRRMAASGYSVGFREEVITMTCFMTVCPFRYRIR
jgi:hypothetical protein